jgi:RNA polymerase sigma-70 factor (ECF subfamily)
MIEKKQQGSDHQSDFEKEMLPHFKLLLNYAMKMTGNSDDAKDLVQETYLKAFRFFNSYEKGTNSKAWLFRIMKNSFINNYRKIANEPQKVVYEEIENFLDLIKDDRVESTNLERIVFDNKLGDEVSEALNSLPKEFRDVIILCDMEGWTYEEIAKYMKCPVGTVRSRIHRGRKMLEKELKSYAEDYGYLK